MYNICIEANEGIGKVNTLVKLEQLVWRHDTSTSRDYSDTNLQANINPAYKIICHNI